jgi:glutamine synthetase
MGDIALNHIIPCAIKYQNTLIQNVTGLKSLFNANEFKKIGATQLEMIEEISEHISMIKKHVEAMVEERKKANAIEHAKKQAIAYCDKVKPHFEIIRYHADKLELVVDNESWPLPKYREMLWMR